MLNNIAPEEWELKLIKRMDSAVLEFYADQNKATEKKTKPKNK